MTDSKPPNYGIQGDVDVTWSIVSKHLSKHSLLERPRDIMAFTLILVSSEFSCYVIIIAISRQLYGALKFFSLQRSGWHEQDEICRLVKLKIIYIELCLAVSCMLQAFKELVIASSTKLITYRTVNSQCYDHHKEQN